MEDMHKIIDQLLAQKGISGSKMSRDLGMSRSFMTELRKGRSKGITAETAQKIADYFDVSVRYLLGTEDNKESPILTRKDEREVSDDDIKFALFGDKSIDDETYESVKNFAKFAAEQKRKRQESEQ